MAGARDGSIRNKQGHELQALRWGCVDLAKGLIRVEWSYDPKEHEFIDVKSSASNRNVPIRRRSLMIAADVNVKAISSYMGHASVKITLDRYGHLMPNSESEAARGSTRT